MRYEIEGWMRDSQPRDRERAMAGTTRGNRDRGPTGTARTEARSVVTTKDLRRAGFPFRSGRLCLDFVATVAKRGMGDRELLSGPAELQTWLRVADLPAAEQPITAEAMTEVRTLREAIHDLVRSKVDGKSPDGGDIATINAAAGVGTPASLLGSDGHTLLPAAQGSLPEIMSIIARDTVDLFTGQYRHRIRACIGHDCSLFFVDRSRPGARRWCAMAACGEKASSAAYRRRHATSQR
jgi:predicted RNA-binding Zn ribbon-like protein